MAVAFDAVSSASPTSGTTSPHTWTHTGVGSNLAVVAAICLDEATTSTTTSCTYNGVSMTLIGSIQSNNANNGILYLYGIANAPTGAQTVSFTFSGTTDVCVGASVSWTGAALTTAAAFGTFQHTAGSAANPGLSVATTLTTSSCICAIASGASTITSMSGGSQKFLASNTSAGTCGSIVGSTAVGTGGNINFTSSIASATYGIGAVEVLPPATVGNPTVQLTPPGRQSPMAWGRLSTPYATQAPPPVPAPVYPLHSPVRPKLPLTPPFGRRFANKGTYAGPKFATLIDNFQRNDIPTLFPTTAGTVRWSPGQCAIQLDTSYSSALGTPVFYDLTSSYLYLHLSAYVSTSTQSSIQLISQSQPTYGFFFGFSASNLNMTKVINNVQTTIYNSGSYNASTMAWIRVRESGGTVFLDQAPDGVTWTNVFSTPDSTFQCPLTALSMLFFCGDFGTDPTGTTYCYAINCVPGPPVYALQGPIRSRVPAPASRSSFGRAISGSRGPYQQLGPKTYPLEGPVRSHLPGPVLHGRIFVQRGVYEQTGPPVYPLAEPVSSLARRGPPPFRGRAISRAGTYTAPAATSVIPTPLGPIRSRVPVIAPRGRIITRAGVFDQLGASVYPLHGPVKGQPQSPVLHGRAVARTGVYDQLGSAVYPQHGPVRAKPAAPVLHGRTISRTGVFDSEGQPVRQLGVIKAQPQAPVLHGRVITRTGTFTAPPTAAPVYPLAGPLRSRIPLNAPRGRTVARVGVYDQLGAQVYPLRGPVRSHVPATFSRGRAISRTGVYDQLGAPTYPLEGPVRTRVPATFSRGRAIAHAGVYDQTGPPAKVWSAPVRAAWPPTFSKGRSIARAGVYDQVGRPVTPLRGPVRSSIPTTFSKGRSFTRSGAYGQLGPPVKPLPGAQARPQFPVLHGRVITRSGTFTSTVITVGPPVYPLEGPLRSRIPVNAPRGRAISRAGTYIFVQFAAPVYPLQGPVRSRVPNVFSKGRTITRAGVYEQTGPPVRPLSQPLRAQPAFPRLSGREIDRAGSYGQLGPPVRPLSSPVKAQPQSPRLFGRVITRSGVFDQIGAPVKTRTGPVRAQWPPTFSRGRQVSRSGVYDQLGPPVIPLRRPVRSPVPAVFSKGRAASRIGMLITFGPPVKPLTGAHARPQYPVLHGRAVSRTGAFSAIAPTIVSATLKLAFNVQQLVSTYLTIAFNVYPVVPFGETLLSDQPWISPFNGALGVIETPWISPFNAAIGVIETPFISPYDAALYAGEQPFTSPHDGAIRAAEQPWVSPQDGTIRMSDQPTTWMQGGNR